MEKLVNPAFWSGRKVLLTGHTGFKGSWLALWLQQMGAKVYGFALPPATQPSLFEQANVANGMFSHFGDLRNATEIEKFTEQVAPDIIFHLAAQALVAEGYKDPVGTYATNVMGTLHLLEAVRKSPSVHSIIVITSDKCYQNREWPWPYRENEALGGYDPYSSSKACTELIASAYRQSFLADKGVGLASARAGNVFGGGDWSENRLIPDLLAAFSTGKTALLRRPQAIRPWQHVLEPLAGYLCLAEHLSADINYATAWNFGPNDADNLSVGQIAKQLSLAWGANAAYQYESSNFPHEAEQLRVDSSLARQRLGWHPQLGLSAGLSATVDWQKAWLSKVDMRAFTEEQITTYSMKQP